MARHRWHIHLLQAIENEYGEPEALGEHNVAASEMVCKYLEHGLGYSDSTVKPCFSPNSGNVPPLAFELYLFAKWAESKTKS